MHILIVNVHSVRNAGDDALLQAAIQQLRAQFADATFTLAMNDPLGYIGDEQVVDSFIHWFRRADFQGPIWQAWRWWAMPWRLFQLMASAGWYRWTGQTMNWGLSATQRDLLQAYSTADLVVSCPGGYLYSTGKLGLWLLVTLLTLAYGVWLGKPVYLLPQTIGPLQNGWERWLLRRLLPDMRQIYVRDDYSRQVLKASGIDHPQLALTPDLAFGFQTPDANAGVALLHGLGIDLTDDQPLLGVTLINWGALESAFQGQAAYEAAVAQAIRAFLGNHGGRAVLFAQVRGPSQAEDDRVPARRVQTLLQDLGQQVVVVEQEVTTAQLKAAYGCMTIFIGSRLHSNIFALTGGVPVIAIAYLPKTHGVMGMLGLAQWVVDIDKVDGVALATLVEMLCTERAAVRTQIDQAIAAQQTAIRQMSSAIAADYQQWAKGKR